MERAEPGPAQRIRKRRRLVGIAVAVLVALCVVVVLAVALTLLWNTPKFKDKFIARCEVFEGYDCQKIWAVFEQVYVGRDPCDVSVEAYQPLLAAVPFPLKCNRMIFWSKTKDVVHAFTKKRDCFVTVEDTLLGSVLDKQTWCGKEGSNETSTKGCPKWDDCETSAVRSFWNAASAAFAEAACGEAIVMLSGDLATPFNTSSVFASIEVPRFRSPKVTSLNVVLVTQKNSAGNCDNASLKDLQKQLGGGIKYNCTEVSKTQIEECSSHTEKPCGACW